MSFLNAAATGALSPVAGFRSLRSHGFRDRRWLLIGLTPIVIVAALIIALTIARGLFYPLFDHGPYDSSWGGPSLAGAWAAHVAVGLVSALIALLVLAGLGRLRSAFEGGEVSLPVRICVAVLGVLGTGILVLWVATQLIPALVG